LLDTLYWGAAIHPRDQYRARAICAREAPGEVRLVTTDEVLTELLDGLAQRGTHSRGRLCGARHSRSRESFLAGLHLYEQRYDKGDDAQSRDFGSLDQ
jgi:hypothetical protein